MNALADCLTMFQRSIRHAVRARDTLILSMVLPIGIMLLFTYVFGGAIDVGGGPYIDYVVPGIMLLCTGFGVSITATAICADAAGGIVDRFRTLPMFRQALLVGHAVEGVVRNIVVIAVAVLFAVVLGYRPGGGPVGVLGALGTMTLFVVAMTWLAIALGLLASTPEAAGALTYVIMFVPYVSSAFVPTSTMPGWLRGFAEHQPATPIVEAVRGQLDSGASASDVAVAAAWCVGLAFLGYAWARMLFARLRSN